MHIRTDDEVYRVDAVWLGPPRATFPWRARYSAYGVGLLVMIVVMFLQRRLGIPLGFFSVAWALLITVLVTRFVSRRINDERPLLEWLTLFAHELRGPRARTRPVGGALTAGRARVRRDRPHGTATPIALPPGSTPAGSARVLGPAGTARTPEPPPASRPAQRTGGVRRARGPQDTPGQGSTAPAHGARRSAPRPARKRADTGFGPPSDTEIGEPVPVRRPADPDSDHPRTGRSGRSGSDRPVSGRSGRSGSDRSGSDRSGPPSGPTPALPPASATDHVAPAMAAWTTPPPAREPIRVRGERVDGSAAGEAGSGAAPGPFGPGARRRPDPAGARHSTGPGRSSGSDRTTDEDDGAPA